MTYQQAVNKAEEEDTTIHVQLARDLDSDKTDTSTLISIETYMRLHSLEEFSSPQHTLCQRHLQLALRAGGDAGVPPSK